jgi:hypothetical protein
VRLAAPLIAAGALFLTFGVYALTVGAYFTAGTAILSAFVEGGLVWWVRRG